MAQNHSIQNSTGYWVTRLARSMEQDFEKRLQTLGITRGAYALLSAIHHDNKTTPAELAGFLGIDGAAVTRHLDRVEKLGLIQRRPATNDRRSIDVSLTTEGVLAVRQGRAHSAATNKRFTRGLSAREVDSLIPTIQAMLANASDNISDV